MKIEVTPDIIRSAERSVSSHCMVANAINEWSRRNGRIYIRVSVDVQTIRFTSRISGERYVFLTPRSVQIAIARFDAGIETPPFTFVLQPRDAAQVTRLDEWRRKGQDKTKSKRRRPVTVTQRIVKLRKSGKVVGTYAPTIRGGNTPPVVPRGTRRMFGMRGLTPDAFLQSKPARNQ